MADFLTDIIQITMEDLQIVEHVCRTDPGVIEQCAISGIPKEDMYKVYCDREDSPNQLSHSLLMVW